MFIICYIRRGKAECERVFTSEQMRKRVKELLACENVEFVQVVYDSRKG